MLAGIKVANNQVVAPMRQAWINELRGLLAELSAKALHYYVSGYEDRKDAEYYQIGLLQQKISLMLNTTEEDHRELLRSIGRLVSLIQDQGKVDSEFPDIYAAVTEISQRVLKAEWNRVKDGVK